MGGLAHIVFFYIFYYFSVGLCLFCGPPTWLTRRDDVVRFPSRPARAMSFFSSLHSGAEHEEIKMQ